MLTLYPRLPREIGRAILREQAGHDVESLRAMGTISHVSAAPAPTGGSPADEEQIARLQAVIRDVAEGAGFPSPLRRGREQEFDRPCGTAIYEAMGIVPADAAAEDVWTFLSVIVVPEIGPWRFPDRTEERLLGRPRNVLRRLWWRAWSLGPDLCYAPEGCTPFGEDEFVGIMERPTLGGNPRTARAVRDTIWRIEASKVKIPRSEVAREVTRRFRAFLAFVSVDAIEDKELQSLLDEVAETAVAAVKAR